MPRGGRRPGAGAPRGNLNGLSSGGYVRHKGHREAVEHLADCRKCDIDLAQEGAVRAGRLDLRLAVEWVYWNCVWPHEPDHFVPPGFTWRDLRDSIRAGTYPFRAPPRR
jgi:hypothetical protein